MLLTNNFSLEEFYFTKHTDLLEKNKDCCATYLGNILAVAVQLQRLRDFLRKPVTITSGFRTPELNLAVGSKAMGSQHLNGSAADFVAEDYKDSKGLEFVFHWCRHNTDYGQIILERPADHAPWIHWGLPRSWKAKTAYIYENGVYKPV